MQNILNCELKKLLNFLQINKNLLNSSRDPAQLLCTFNARINAQDNKGNTPLHYCIAYNNLEVMQVILSKGASMDIKNHKV